MGAKFFSKRQRLHSPVVTLDEDGLVARNLVELGRLVTNPKKPWADFNDAPAVVLENIAPLIVVQEYYDSEEIDRAGDPENAVLKRLFSLTSSKLTRIEARRSQKYSLMNQNSVFSEICSLESARTFLERNMSRGKGPI